MTIREIEVHVDLAGRVRRVGTLWCQLTRGRESAAFQYHPAWLGDPKRFSLEPALMLGSGQFVPAAQRPLFGSLGDSAPDTWGRRLMQRAERRAARRDGRAVRTLTEADYLLGVSDHARLGALRFRDASGTTFLSPGGPDSVPPMVELPRLLAIADRVHRNEETDEDVRLLFAPGSSLGGARPKASVRGTDGRLWIAKLPKPDDDYSLERWEAIAMDLAGAAGVRVPEHRSVDIAGRPALLTRRFDRQGEERIPFLSALAMLDQQDGQRGSYPEIVDALRGNGAESAADGAELFRRVAFNILISNVDDHLRNHGFLRSGAAGWRLSPAYDLNPVPQDVKPRILSTNIDLEEATCSLDLLRASAGYYGLGADAADAAIGEVGMAVAGWRSVADRHAAPRAEIERMASAFEHEDLQQAVAGRRSYRSGGLPPAEPLQADSLSTADRKLLQRVLRELPDAGLVQRLLATISRLAEDPATPLEHHRLENGLQIGRAELDRRGLGAPEWLPHKPLRTVPRGEDRGR